MPGSTRTCRRSIPARTGRRSTRSGSSATPRGSPLYVPYACEGGTCPQYAADIGDPAFREAWLEQTAEKLRHGYRGLYIDDVNLTPHVGDGTGQIVMPVDERTGATMTAADWNRYMADFVELVRKRFPSIEIVHNSLWWLGDSVPTSAASRPRPTSSTSSAA